MVFKPLKQYLQRPGEGIALSNNEGVFCLYQHTAPNGKKYIGITSLKPERRWRNEGRGYASNHYFQSAILKHGWGNMKHEVLVTGIDEDTAKRLEIELIAHHKTQDPRYGYNITAGGESATGYHHTDEFKARASALHTGNTYRLGSNATKETKAKMSAARKGLQNSLGFKHTDKTRAKMSASHNKAVIQYKEDKEIAHFISIMAASKVTHTDHGDISKCCNGKRAKAGGFEWRFA